MPGVQIPGIHIQQPSVSTEVLCLLNMVTEDELRDDDEYEGKIFTNDGTCLIKTICFFVL